MVADVSSLVRILNSYNEEQQRKQQVENTDHQGNTNSNTDHQGNTNSRRKSKVLITRDLLGSCCSSSSSLKFGSKELDLDLQVPNGWEKRLDMKSGEIYIQRCNSPISSSSSSGQQNDAQKKQEKQSKMIHPEIQDLNYPSSKKLIKNHLSEEETEKLLDLKLLVVPSYDYQSSSVCTLDKVKSALERAERESSSSSSILKKRTLTISSNGGGASSSSCSSSSPLSNMIINKQDQDKEGEKKKKKLSSSSSIETSSEGLVMVAAGCPGCLSYVLISKGNPKCPRCESIIVLSSPSPAKKPRIDLNISI